MGASADVLSLPEAVGLLLFLALSAFFSGAETALFSLRRSRVEELARGEAGRRGRAVARLLTRPHDLLVAILFGNLVVNTLFFALSALVAFRLQEPRPGLAAAVALGGLAAVVVFGEVVPKSLAVVVAEPVALWAGPLVAGFEWALRPVLGAFLRVSDVVSRFLVGRPVPPHVTADELKVLVELSEEQGLIGAGEESLLVRVVELGEMSVREVMLPRVDMLAFELGRPREELVALLRRTRREVIPVHRGGLDAVVGVVRSARVLLEPAGAVEELVEPVALVPGSWTVDELLREFRRRGLQVAVVVDEYGGTEGLLRLSDLLAAVLGRAPATAQTPSASYDALVEPAMVEQVGPGSLLLDARLSIRALGDQLDRLTTTLSEVEGEVHGDQPFDVAQAGAHRVPTEWAGATVEGPGGVGLRAARPVTVGGLVITLLGRWPVVGDQVGCPSPDGRRNLRFTVVEMRGRRLTKVRVDVATEGGQSRGPAD